MKLDISANELKKLVLPLEKNIPVRPFHPIMRTILMDASKDGISLKSFDGSTYLEITADIPVSKPGVACIDGHLFTDMVVKLKNDTVLLSTDKEEFTLLCAQKSKSKLPLANVEEFCEWKSCAIDPILLTAEQLRSAFRQTAFTVSTDESKAILTGVHFSSENGIFDVAATNGHYCAHHSFEFDGDGKHTFLLPGKAVEQLMGLLKPLKDSDAVQAKIERDQAQFEFTAGDHSFVFGTRLLEGQYPNYKQLYQGAKTSIKVTVPTNEMLDALDVVGVIASQKNNVVVLDFDGEQLTVSAEAGSIGSSEFIIACEAEGQIKVAFNMNYLKEITKSIEDRLMVLAMGTPTSPAIIQADDQERTTRYLIMPVQIRE